MLSDGLLPSNNVNLRIEGVGSADFEISADFFQIP